MATVKGCKLRWDIATVDRVAIEVTTSCEAYNAVAKVPDLPAAFPTGVECPEDKVLQQVMGTRTE